MKYFLLGKLVVYNSDATTHKQIINDFQVRRKSYFIFGNSDYVTSTIVVIACDKIALPQLHAERCSAQGHTQARLRVSPGSWCVCVSAFVCLCLC
jgi:hypothetical protein